MDAAQTVIHVENVTCAYGERVVLQDVSFEVRRGEILFIVGGSGCGKSTLLKHMIGLRDPAAGRILILGGDLARAEGAERQALLRRFGVMYQSGALFGSMALLQNVQLPLEEFTKLPPRAVELVARLKLSLVGLAESAHSMPAALSGGMQKRAAIARAMALDPDILFLDEPSAGLDPVTSAELDALIASLADNLGMTFVIVSHELASIDAIADRVVLLDAEVKGVAAIGAPHELVRDDQHPAVRRFFHRRPAPRREGGRDEGPQARPGGAA